MSAPIAAVALALAATACSKGETAQARGRDDAAKPVKVEAVAEQTVTRVVESSARSPRSMKSRSRPRPTARSADPARPRRPRARRRRAGRARSREGSNTTSTQQRAALARALAQYGAPDPQHLPDVEKTPDVQKASGGSRAGEAGVRPRQRAVQAHAGAAADARRCRDRAAVEAGRATTRRCRTRRTSGQHPGGRRGDEAGRPPAARHLHPRAVRRLRRRSGFVNLGELVKARARRCR